MSLKAARKKMSDIKLAKIDDFMDEIDLEQPVIDRSREIEQIYSLGLCLGKGGFAKVFLSFNNFECKKYRAQPVAIKLIPMKRVQRQDQKDRIDNEVEIHGSLDHPNIVKMISSFRDETKICMVLEFCPDRTIGDLMKTYDDKCLPEKRAVTLFAELLAALSYLHSIGILHRDIKLGNILIKDGHVKLADFGLAINYFKNEQRHICGTPNFLAPEVFDKKRHFPASDIWAAGCVLYCLLVGRSPFKFTTMSETAQKIRNVDYDLPRDLSLEARQCLKSILTKDLQERYTPSKILKTLLFTSHLPQSNSQRGLSAFGDATNLTGPPLVPPKPKNFTLEPHKEQKINRV